MNPSLRIVLAAALSALAGLSFAPVFGGLGAALLLAVLVPPAVVIVWALWTHRSPRVHSGHVAFGMVAVAIAVTATTWPGGAVASGPYRLLTSALPIDPSGPQLATASALSGYAALIACYLALTRRAALAPVLPAFVCLLAGLGLGAATGPLPAWYPSAFVGLAGVHLLVNRAAESGHGVGRGLIATAAVVLAVGVLAPIPLAGLAPGSDARTPATLRSVVSGPVLPRTNTNPFAQYVALFDGHLVLKITGSASEPVDRLRMITLTEFDGHTWSARADYRRAGHQLPPAPVTTDARQVTIDVSVSNPDALGWLPTAGRATEVSVPDLGVDEGTGDIVIPAGSTMPKSYRVTGTEPVIEGGEILDDDPERAATPPGIELPPDILGFITTATAQSLTDSERLLALYQALTKPPFGYDGSAKDVPGGHGLYQISALLRDKRGTSEQYASAFAVMCRQLGWNARVVLGFRPQWNGNTLTVTGENVHAWAEVRFNRLGWVPVDPTPRQASPGREPGGQAPAPLSDPLEALPASPSPPENPADGPSQAASWPAPPAYGVATWVTVTIVTGGGLAVLVLAIPVAKTIRRARRRRHGTPRTRAVAAWLDVLDTLREAGLRVPHAATTGEVIAVRGPDCPPAMYTLAQRTNFAAFAPDQTTETDARAAWTDSDTIRRTTRGHGSILTRLRSTFNPRPLLTRHR
jgi:transglutaminase-like putative cysteine protease